MLGSTHPPKTQPQALHHPHPPARPTSKRLGPQCGCGEHPLAPAPSHPPCSCASYLFHILTQAAHCFSPWSCCRRGCSRPPHAAPAEPGRPQPGNHHHQLSKSEQKDSPTPIVCPFTGWSKAPVTNNISLTNLKNAKNGLTQWFLESIYGAVLVFWCLKITRWKKMASARLKSCIDPTIK